MPGMIGEIVRLCRRILRRTARDDGDGPAFARRASVPVPVQAAGPRPGRPDLPFSAARAG